MSPIYRFAHSLDPTEIGEYPPIQGFTGKHNYWAEDGFFKVPLEGRINYDIKFPVFKLGERSKITDLLSAPTDFRFIMVSNKLLDLFRKFKIDEFQCFQVDLQFLDSILTYNLIYFVNPREKDYIDWPNTKFRLATPLAQAELGEIQINDLDEYLFRKKDLIEKREEIHVTTLQFQHQNIDCDLFRFLWACNGYYISARLKKAIEENGITGVRFMEADGLRTPI